MKINFVYMNKCFSIEGKLGFLYNQEIAKVLGRKILVKAWLKYLPSFTGYIIFA